MDTVTTKTRPCDRTQGSRVEQGLRYHRCRRHRDGRIRSQSDSTGAGPGQAQALPREGYGYRRLSSRARHRPAISGRRQRPAARRGSNPWPVGSGSGSWAAAIWRRPADGGRRTAGGGRRASDGGQLTADSRQQTAADAWLTRSPNWSSGPAQGVLSRTWEREAQWPLISSDLQSSPLATTPVANTTKGAGPKTDALHTRGSSDVSVRSFRGSTRRPSRPRQRPSGPHRCR